MILQESSGLRPRNIALVLIALFASMSILPRVTPAAAAAPATSFAGMVIPLYTYPTDGSWSAVIEAKQAYPSVPIIAVVNPDTGPGYGPDPNYVKGIENLQAAGVQVVGYVYTSQGTRVVSSVESDVGAYNAWYHVNGIFFDEMASVAGYERYYSTLNAFVHSLGMTTTIGNAGTSLPSSYVGTVNIICINEWSGFPSMSFLSYPGYSPSNFMDISYGDPLSVSFIDQAASLTSWIYLTDASGANPYGVLPSYLMSEVGAMSAIDRYSASFLVTAVDLSGGPLNGLWTTTSDEGGNLLSSGFTPSIFFGTVGSAYVVNAPNYQNYVFCHWQDGDANPAKTPDLAGDVTLTAYYSTTGSCPTTTVTVDTAMLDGTQFGGMWLTIKSGGRVIASGYSDLTFRVTVGARYSISMSNYEGLIFESWSTGSGNSSIIVAPTHPTTLIAYYS